MKLLYITQFFYPEIGATTNRALANVRYLSKKGHNVTVLTEMPNHPKGIIFNGYKKKIFLKEKMENFSINRVWVFTSTKKNFVTRMLFYLTFMFMGIIHTLHNWKKYDIIYVTSPPLFVGVIGLFFKKIFPKTKLIFEVRDLWPSSAVEAGELNNSFIIKISEYLEQKIYKKSDMLITVTRGIYSEIEKRFPNKIYLISNGIDVEIFKKKRNTDSKFIVVFTGNHGLMSSLETIIKAANLLKNESIYFQFIGDGPIKKRIKKITCDLKLDNVEFIDSISIDKISDYLSVASVGVSTSKKLQLNKGRIPVKIFGYMACELPIVLSEWGESVDIIEKAQCGISVEPEDYQQLAKAFLWMKAHPKERIKMGINGRKFVEINYNRMKKAEELEKILIDVVLNKHEI